MLDGIGQNVGCKFQSFEKAIQYSYSTFFSIVNPFFYFQSGDAQGCCCEDLQRACWFRWWKISSRENKRKDQKEERKWLLPKHILGDKGRGPNGLQRYVPLECHWLWVLIKPNF